MKLNKNRFTLLTLYSKYIVYAHTYMTKRVEIYRYFLCKAINNISIYTRTWHKKALHSRNFTISLKKLKKNSKFTKGTEQRQSLISKL